MSDGGTKTVSENKGAGDSDEILAPGFVFACDIQLFRVDEGIGIRIEDTVAVTESGCECLSRGVPRTVAEIEALMRTEGILQALRGQALI